MKNARLLIAGVLLLCLMPILGTVIDRDSDARSVAPQSDTPKTDIRTVEWSQGRQIKPES
jgi:hypothetical protein